MTTPLTCVTDGRRKLVRFGDELLLYDLDADPLELSPEAAPQEQADLALLRDALAHPGLRAPRVGPSPAPEPPAVDADELAKLEERMKLLGYM